MHANHGDGNVEEYFRELAERVGKTFTREQKLWYASKQLEQGMFFTREYPSTMEEAMTAPVEGSIYGETIARRRAEGAIGPIAIDPTAVVHTSWDLGSPINTVCWYFQIVGRELRVIDVDLDCDLTVRDRVKGMIGKGYVFECHFLPHDAAARQYSGRTFAADLDDAGLLHTRIVPRTDDEWTGINHMRQEMLPRMSFRLPECETGVSRLEAYHTARETSGGTRAQRAGACHQQPCGGSAADHGRSRHSAALTGLGKLRARTRRREDVFESRPASTEGVVTSHGQHAPCAGAGDVPTANGWPGMLPWQPVFLATLQMPRRQPRRVQRRSARTEASTSSPSPRVAEV